MRALIAIGETREGELQVLGSGTDQDRDKLAGLLEESKELVNRRVVCEGASVAWFHDIPDEPPKKPARKPKAPASSDEPEV